MPNARNMHRLNQVLPESLSKDRWPVEQTSSDVKTPASYMDEDYIKVTGTDWMQKAEDRAVTPPGRGECPAVDFDRCLTIIPERVTIKHVNDKYISNVSANVRRSSKRGQYVFNMKLINKTVLGNNVTLHVTVYEHNSRYNQYVRTLMEFHYKWCDLVLRDILFGRILRKYGITECPILPGPVAVANMSFSGNFPFTILFEKGKFEATWKVGSTGEAIGSLDVFVGFGKSR